MQTLGLIGGMSWESTLEYYRLINLAVREKLGSPHSCKSLIYSVDFAEISDLQHKGEWERLTVQMLEIARVLEKSGAELIIICTNTMHIMAEDVEKGIEVPLLHIADATAGEIKEMGLEKVGLLGTRFTMEKDFYAHRLKEKHGIKTIIPPEEDRKIIHEIIYNELIAGKILAQSRNEYIRIINGLKDRGAQGVVMGCTEIPLLIGSEDSSLPLFDTTGIHARKAVEMALSS